MSCDTSANKAARAARSSGISPAGSKSGFNAGSTAQVSFFAWTGRKSGSNRPQKRLRKTDQPAGRRVQASFFERAQNGGNAPAGEMVANQAGSLPDRRQIRLSRDFTPEELDRLAVQINLGAAATARHIRELDSGRSRGIGHSDPRPLDWAQLDRQQYQFLADQLRRARRGAGYIDTMSLKKKEMVELWEFARFETDRAHRNIDHLTSGLSHLKGPTADYLAGGHKLEARFYSFLADQLETIVPAEALVKQTW